MAINELQAAKAAQQAAQKGAAEQSGPKQGPSKFDEAMQAKGPTAEKQVQAAQQVQKAQMTRGVEQVQATTQAQLNKKLLHDAARNKVRVTHKSDASKVSSGIAKMLEDIEKGQGVMDKLIKSSASGREFSNSELIALQAGMYKYTQELELTGKVVEKATSGLKDTLKTQV